MYHCHPCFGGHKPVGPICTTPPVVHPTKQCVTNTFSTTVVPHIHPTHTTHVHHQQVKSQHFFPQTVSNVNVVEPVAPGFGGPGVGGFGGPGVGGFGGPGVGGFGGPGVGGFGGPCGHGHHVSPYGPGPNVGPQVSPYGPGPNVGGMFKK
ncbi:CotD family spore coat protein [Bacillus pseudomycoides]|uniref:CotD family spore coat protein n=1 Tax=Bacillus pseudomycoides TaxID=64104 RepID=UPI0004ED8821|nr:CotD family spore coat protein [Bacillus pseudomycoides]AIK36116.1 inner spore coat D family protein [Bacillus pseudomycoides]PGE16431.1 spore coat protein [Bacillus pseudomycoides]